MLAQTWFRSEPGGKMQNFKYAKFAEALVLVHGCRAKTEAAVQAAICERAGDTKMVESWQVILEYLRSTDLREKSKAA
jgi:hypothetical protein